jgi:hypoxanthine-guanine phosphoribosyltransferase
MTGRPNIRLILSAIDLKSTIATIASKIAADHKDTRDDPVVLIIVLNGVFMFGADLARALHARKVSCVYRISIVRHPA